MSEYEWRIKLELPDGKTHTMCWLPVADGEFQNLNCRGRLEFRLKPEKLTINMDPRHYYCGHPGCAGRHDTDHEACC